jgi:hypothetical protein
VLRNKRIFFVHIWGSLNMGDRKRKSRTTIMHTVALVVMTAGLAAPAMAAKTPSIGTTALVVRDVEGKTEEQIRQLALQDSVYQNEIVQTGLKSASELKFADETRISVGPNSSVVLDEFVYDPDPGEGTFALQVTEGVFRFFSGNMASSNYKIETPTVTVGVRGTVLVIVARGDGAVAVIMESDDGVEVTNGSGDTVLLETPGKATVAFANGTMTPPGEPPAWALLRIREMDDVLATAGLPRPPPVKPETTEPAESAVDTAVAPPPPPPEPEPTVTEAPPKRGLPRAAYARGGDIPAGGEQANDMAKLPEPPGAGAAATAGEEGDVGPPLIAGDGGDGADANGKNNNGGGKGNSSTAGSQGNGNGNDGGNGNGNAGGKGNGKGGA